MSNLGLADRLNAAIESRDEAELKALVAEDAVWDMSRSRGPYPGVYRGHDEIRGLVERQLEAWEGMRVRRISIHEIGDHLAEEVRVALTGRGSGVEIEAQGARVYEFRAGKIVRFTMFQNMDEAKEFVDSQP
jgi:ketosteroid isomerase-like protein